MQEAQMTLTETKYERLDQIERLLAHNPNGMTTRELAEALAVDPTTILRDIAFLDGRGTKIDKDGRRYKLNHRRSLYTVKLTSHEILALYLAARLLSRHSDEHNPHVVLALEKLSDALNTRSPLIARHMLQAADAVRHRRFRRDYVEALEILTQGWIEGRSVWFRYRDNKNQVTERIFAPYFLEPSGIGYSCYAIGFDQRSQDKRTFKIERMSEARLTEERFSIPAEFDPQRLLLNAWGVIYRDDASTEVTLRFLPQVVRRMKESVWHHSQRLEDLPDGSCLFTVQVGSTLEMKPWIRQWGSAVEVLEPPDLRAELIAEVREMMGLYAPK
jgi:predicted DNA-binding transcriptional regulator YafY